MRLTADEPYPRSPGMTGAARAARRLATNRNAKAAQRGRERAAGSVDRETLDRALVGALAELLSVGERSLTTALMPAAIVKIAHVRILERGERQGARLDKDVLMAALGDRLLRPRGVGRPGKSPGI